MLIVYIYINLVKLKNNLVQISRITFFWDEKEIKGSTYTSVPTIKGVPLIQTRTIWSQVCVYRCMLPLGSFR